MASNHMYTAGDNRNDPTPSSQESQDAVSDKWLDMARDSFTASTDYFDANIRKGIERNLAHFGNRHAPGSKYYSESYKYRSKGFRPKTRAVVQKNLRAAAIALFSTGDIVDVQAEDDGNLVWRVSAEINQRLLQYRLENTVPWFLTALGAYEDTLVSGVCISHQFWDFQEEISEYPMIDPATNLPVIDELGEPVIAEERKIVRDTMSIELRPVENVRFSPAADWRDPLNSSPYLIDMIPMTIEEVKRRSQQTEKTRIPWFPVTDAQLLAGKTSDYDPIRSQREGGRSDSKDQSHATTDFDTVWVHRNIVRQGGRDWVFYTLGVHARLSDPIPLSEEYPHLRPGVRPYVLGTSSIETHKNYPESLAGIAASIQQEANDISNQRRDNVALVLNRRYIARRGASVDYQSLIRNIPGSITLVDDIHQDIRIEAPPEITGSSYQEQDRVNMDMDELTGSFSTSSVASNRQLNETVGGMELLSGDSNDQTEFNLRVFVTTWVEPVLKQMIQLQQYYETDEALLRMMGEKVKMWERFGVDKVTDRMIQGSMMVRVNVGFGATNPQQRINKLALGLNTALQFAPHMAGRLDGDEVASEVFGVLGYKNVERFFPLEPDPNKPPMPAPPPDPRLEVEKLRAQNDMQLEQARQQFEMQKQQGAMEESRMAAELKLQIAYLERESKMLELAAHKELTLEQIKAKLGETAIKERGSNERFLAEREFALTAGGGRGF